MRYTDDLHELFIADDSHDPLDVQRPSADQLSQAFDSMIISASGWRKIFAESGDEEDPTEEVSSIDRFLAALIVLSFSRHLAKERQTILVGLDARPTGRLLGEIAVRLLTSLGHQVHYLFITAAPQIMAASIDERFDAFFYISASHNPIGHNGFKMGSRGGVYDGQTVDQVAKIFRALVDSGSESCREVQQLSANVDMMRYQKSLASSTQDRLWSSTFYRDFALRTATGSPEAAAHQHFIEESRRALQAQPLGIVGELNGSARAASIDHSLLSELGVTISLYNDRPGEVVHPIIPEGKNLDLCRSLLEERWRANSAFVIGYSVDNDGDRGNIVYIDERTREARILDAQSVYALSLISALAQSRLRNPQGKLATVVNGPTSMRIDAICALFDAAVFRSEVGEANVVNLAEQKRKEGWEIPILGEGSNGGNITHPARVRDPLNTLLALLQLLRSREVANLWFSCLGRSLPTTYSLSEIIETIPTFITTAVVDNDALMIVNSDHGKLKRVYEDLFEQEWPEHQKMLAQWSITAWKVEQMEGTLLRQGVGEAYRTVPYTGGYKTILLDDAGRQVAFMWMRGSKTEPVYRLMVDVEGKQEALHDYLLEWHRSLVQRADSADHS